jgi:hypothetical protein
MFAEIDRFVAKYVQLTEEEGAETILLFAVEDWWVSDLTSFAERHPSNLFIETIEDCDLLSIDYSGKALPERSPATLLRHRLTDRGGALPPVPR